MFELMSKFLNVKKLYVNGNSIKDVDIVDFIEFEGFDLFYLGSNQIIAIKGDVFYNFTNLRRLYFNGNQIERFYFEIFFGFYNLQYLYLEYNLIKEILVGIFDLMLNLQLLYLNNNFLKSLFVYIFFGVFFVRLNLRNNKFMYLFVSGVFDQLQFFIQIDLEGNSWDCICDLVVLKLWLEKLNDGIVVKELKCETFVQFVNIELKFFKNEILCFKFLNKLFVLFTSFVFVITFIILLGFIRSFFGGLVFLFILILSILVVFILIVFVVFCFFVFVFRRNKKFTVKYEGLGNLECGFMQLQLRKYDYKINKKDGLSIEVFIL